MANTNNTYVTPTDTADDWKISTDVYEIVDTVNNLKKRYIEDQSSDTLAVGIFGFLGDVESKKIQSSAIMTAHYSNEMFPSRAQLTKNVISHAIFNGITGINAVPAVLTVNIGIKSEDIEYYMRDTNKFVIDCNCPFFIQDYEFHLEYDIILSRSFTSAGVYAYSAHYDMTEKNRLSSVGEPYLMQPFTVKLNNDYYLIFQTKLRQYTIEETIDKIISNSVIENKTFTFEFDNQLADFDVYITSEGETTRLQPVLEGTDVASVLDGTDKYCYYTFISENTVRITFDSVSYLPSLNSDILVKAYTTLGEDGNFTYKNSEDGTTSLFFELESEKYNYNKITCYMATVSDSLDGTNKKSKEELQKLIPIMAHSRNSITTEEDLENYLNLISSDKDRIVPRKKVDNNIDRVWYTFYIMKDQNNNIIPTNTINILVNSVTDMHQIEDGRLILPSGTTLCYDPNDGYAVPIDDADIPTPYTNDYYDGKFYYMLVHDMLLDLDPLYCAYYQTCSTNTNYFIFNWVNETSLMQFVATQSTFKRSLMSMQSEYMLTFTITQSIAADVGLYNPDTGVNNMKMILVFFKDDAPYRWKECTMDIFDESTFSSSWTAILDPDPYGFDTKNDIRISNVNVAGSTSENYGYFTPNTKVYLYTLAKFSDGEYGRYDLDTIAPGFTGYTVTNVYEVNNGITFYTNYTKLITTEIEAQLNNNFKIKGVPVCGFHYIYDDTNADYFITALNKKKDYIDQCIEKLECPMEIDFKFFNTYGYSLTYSVSSSGFLSVGNIDMVFRFKTSLKSISDIYTRSDITKFVKEYIENIEDIGSLHIPNLITEVTNEFVDRINYFEFLGFNNFGPGTQHIIEQPVESITTVPEFLSIRNHYDDAMEIVPWIDIEIV